MLKLRSKVLGGIGALAIAGVLAATGLTAASASQAASNSGFEHFQILNTSGAPSVPASIIARGLFTAGGTVTNTTGGSPTGTVTFPDGTFAITHSRGTGTPRFNPKTCLGVLVLNGTYTLGQGTGAYAGISGHGIYRLNILFVAARNSAGKCSGTLPPAAFQQIIKAQGPVSL